MNDADIAHDLLDVPELVADGIRIVDGGPVRPMGMIQLPSG